MKTSLIYIFLIVFPSVSQISVDVISTDTLDIFNVHLQETQQTPQAISWLSFLVPGSGHHYIKRYNKAFAYISFDVFALAGVIFFKQYSNKLVADSKSFAANYAGISSSVNDDYYWQLIGSFDNYSDYHQTINLVRENEKRYTEQRFFWMWQDETLRNEYVTIQKRAKQFNTISSFFIGTLVLNRLISFIDLRSTIKNNRFKNTTLSFRPVSYGPMTNGIVLETGY